MKTLTKSNEERAKERFNEVKRKASLLNKRVTRLLNEYQFGYTNVKLHDVACKLSDMDEYTEEVQRLAFELFCEVEYEYFQDYLLRNDLTTEPIGRTSSFIIAPSYATEIYQSFYNDTVDPWDVITQIDAFYIGSCREEDVMKLSYGSFDSLKDFFNDGRVPDVDTYEDWINEETVFDDMNEIDTTIDQINHELKDVVKELKTVQAAHDFIDDYKAKQVDTFMEWFNAYSWNGSAITVK